MKKKLFATMLTIATVMSSSLPCLAASKTDVNSNDQYGYQFENRINQILTAGETPTATLNCDYWNPEYGDEHDLLRLYDANGEEVSELQAGETYEGRIYLCAHSMNDADAAENVNLDVSGYFVSGGDMFKEIKICSRVNYGVVEDYYDPESHVGHTSYAGQINYSRIFRVENPDRIEFSFEFVGDVEIRNNGQLNESGVDYRRPLNNANTYMNLTVGYDSQDGVLPSGAEYACEVIFQIRLSEVKPVVKGNEVQDTNGSATSASLTNPMSSSSDPAPNPEPIPDAIRRDIGGGTNIYGDGRGEEPSMPEVDQYGIKREDDRKRDNTQSELEKRHSKERGEFHDGSHTAGGVPCPDPTPNGESNR